MVAQSQKNAQSGHTDFNLLFRIMHHSFVVKEFDYVNYYRKQYFVKLFLLLLSILTQSIILIRDN